ncbi:MAG: hypothetical protein LBC73_10805, partial [Oscillospiraceae bacterium]|nr:hypothetical protein [Oscillospiraceae bacterium]
MIKQISNRLTGKKSIKLKEEIQKIYSRRELVDEIRTKPTNEKADNYWLDWYINIFLKTYDDNYIKARKLQQILPLTLMPKSKANLIKNVHNCIINYAKVALLSGDYITCKQIRLPKPLTDAELINHISDAWDILLPYAIEEYGEDLYIRLFSLLGTLPQSLWREGPYEYKNVRLNESDIVIDAGANMGWFAAVVSAKAGVSHSFEPVQCTRENYLVKTAELNKNIIIHDYALSDKKSEMKLHYDNKDSVSATLVDYR